MKKVPMLTQWIFAAIFGICVLGNGFHWSSLPLILGTLLMMPIPVLRKLLNGLKLKNWLIITLAVIVFCFGILNSPLSEESDTPDHNAPSYSDGSTPGETPDGDDDSDNSSYQDGAGDETPDDPDDNTPQGGSDNDSSDDNTNQGGTGDDNTPDDPGDDTTPDNPDNGSPDDTPNQGGDSTGDTSDPSDDNTSNPSENDTPSSVGNGVATPADPTKLPAYSGTPYVVVDNNIPSFSASELTTIGYEFYSDLDSLGRCGFAIASCGKEIMPAEGEERGSISSIKPSGWVQAQYSGISGGYLWNRCHLIGWQLSAENANRKNLITGTKYMNVSGMLPFENMVADYIRETNNHVAFRVTPIFEGNNLVCSGVQLEAYSIEDKGEGIQFNVYCYNVQPGITIDYATGNSSSNSQSNDDQNNNDTPDDNTSTDKEEMVWIPSSGTKYHSKSSCSNMKNPTQVTKEEAEKQGYEPCKRCH